MTKIPFDIKYRPQIESGEYKVETGDGRSVRIISWDKKVFGGSTEIVALVSTPKGDTETVQLYCPDGKLIVSSWNEKFKLFIVTPEPEMSKFEKKLVEMLMEATGKPESNIKINAVKETATELLFLAREQLLQSGELLTQEHHEKLMDALQNEALKDLPRWKKASGKERFSERMIVLVGNNDLFCTNYAEEGEYYLPFHILEKLPKEDESHE